MATMAVTETEQAQKFQREHTPAPKLLIDFSWMKFKARVTEVDKPSEPLYIIHYHPVTKPSIIFKTGDDKTTIGTGTLHAISSINCEYTIHGHAGKLKALKRFGGGYSHLSHAFSDTDSPALMTWVSNCGWETWDFVCLDEQQMPVAKFAARSFSITRIGHVEFLGPKTISAAAKEEILVTGMTLMYMTVGRASNFLSIPASILSKPGPLKKEEVDKLGHGAQERDSEGYNIPLQNVADLKKNRKQD